MLEFFRLSLITWDTGAWFVFQLYVLFVWAVMLPRQLLGTVFHHIHRGAHQERRTTRTPVQVIATLFEIVFACAAFALLVLGFRQFGIMGGIFLTMVLVLVLSALRTRVIRPAARALGRSLVWVAVQPQRLLRLMTAQCFYVEHLAYLAQAPRKRFAVTAVVTIYREDPQVLREALARVRAALRTASVEHVFVALVDGLVDQGEHDTLATIARQHCDIVLGADARNKRWNLRLLVRMADHAFACKYRSSQYDPLDRITVFMDSDTLPIGSDRDMVLARLIRHFADPRLGGVTTAQEIHKPGRNQVRRLNHWLERARLFSSQATMSLFGQVACLPGRLYAVRTSLIEGQLDDLVNDTFSYWGLLRRPCIAGDDRFFTNCVLKAGYRTVLEPSARVATECPDSFLETCRMWTRWGRSSQGYTLRSPWLIRYKIALFIYASDILVSVSTVLIITVHWPLMALLGDSHVLFLQALVLALLGMVLTMSIRQMPHLVRSPRDILVLPLFVLVVTIGQFVRVYALMTQHKIGTWGTRGGATASHHPRAWVMSDPQRLTAGFDLPQ